MTNTFKRVMASFVAIVLALGVGLGLAGCGGGNSDEALVRAAIENMMDAFKNPTKESLEPYMKEVDQSTLDQLDEYGVDIYDMLGHFFKHFEYTINDVTIDGDTGTASLSVTNADIEKAVQESTNGLMEDEEFVEEFRNLYTSGDEKGAYKLIFDKMFAAIDASEETVTTDIEVKLTKKDGQWDIDDSSVNEFVSAMYGGMDLSNL